MNPGKRGHAGLEDLRFVDRPFISLSPLLDRPASRLEGPTCSAPCCGGRGSGEHHSRESRVAWSALAQTLRLRRYHGDGRSTICRSHSLSFLSELSQSHGGLSYRGGVAGLGWPPALPAARYG